MSTVKISTTNTKLGIIPSINLPPIVTCRENCPCSKECYALKGNFRFKNVKESHLHNYNAYFNSPAEYFTSIIKEISNGFVTYCYFRWHASGDIIDDSYLNGMVAVAKALPNTKFLAFTKKFELINNYLKNNDCFPQNLNVVFSAWGNELDVVNPYNLPVAYVRFKDEERNGEIPSFAVECGGNCTNCLKCWEIKNGESVVFNKH